jgi:hypothetical protein
MAEQRAETCGEVTTMIGWGIFKRLLKINQSDYDLGADAQVTEVRLNLLELERSQRSLRHAVEDTGFFLGDALVRQPYDRARARNHGS